MRRRAILLAVVLGLVGFGGRLQAQGELAILVPDSKAEAVELAAPVDRSFYTGNFNYYYQPGGLSSTLSASGYATTANGGTVSQVKACFYNESAFSRTFRAAASVKQAASTIQSISFQKSFPSGQFSCHTLTGFNAHVGPGEFQISISYNEFEAENLFAGIGATSSGSTFDVQIGSQRPPYATGPQGPVLIRGVGIGYRIAEDDSPPPPPPPADGCVTDVDTACLLAGRFKVEISWTNFEGVTQAAKVAAAGTPDSALFYFGSNIDNWEFLVKAIDACSLNGKYWIYFAAATNVGYTVTVTDTQEGGFPKVYENPVGNLAQAVNDIEAFSCSE